MFISQTELLNAILSALQNMISMAFKQADGQMGSFFGGGILLAA